MAVPPPPPGHSDRLQLFMYVCDRRGLQKRTFYTTQESGSTGSWLSVATIYLCFDVFNFTWHLTTDTQIFRFPGVFKALKKFVSFSLP